MYCNQCGCKNQDGAFFCLQCNAPLGELPVISSGGVARGTFGARTNTATDAASGQSRSKDRAAVFGFFVAMLATSFSFSWMGPLIALVAIALCAVGLKSRRRGFAIAGMALGISIIGLMLLGLVFAGIYLR